MHWLIIIGAAVYGVYSYNSSVAEFNEGCNTMQIHATYSKEDKQLCQERRLDPNPVRRAEMQKAWEARQELERKMRERRAEYAKREKEWKSRAVLRANAAVKRVRAHLNVPKSGKFSEVHYIEYNGRYHTCGFVSGKNLFGVELPEQPFVALGDKVVIGSLSEYVQYCTASDRKYKVYI